MPKHLEINHYTPPPQGKIKTQPLLDSGLFAPCGESDRDHVFREWRIISLDLFLLWGKELWHLQHWFDDKPAPLSDPRFSYRTSLLLWTETFVGEASLAS